MTFSKWAPVIALATATALPAMSFAQPASGDVVPASAIEEEITPGLYGNARYWESSGFWSGYEIRLAAGSRSHAVDIAICEYRRCHRYILPARREGQVLLFHIPSEGSRPTRDVVLRKGLNGVTLEFTLANAGDGIIALRPLETALALAPGIFLADDRTR